VLKLQAETKTPVSSLPRSLPPLASFFLPRTLQTFLFPLCETTLKSGRRLEDAPLMLLRTLLFLPSPPASSSVPVLTNHFRNSLLYPLPPFVPKGDLSLFLTFVVRSPCERSTFPFQYSPYAFPCLPAAFSIGVNCCSPLPQPVPFSAERPRRVCLPGSPLLFLPRPLSQNFASRRVSPSSAECCNRTNFFPLPCSVSFFPPFPRPAF